MLLSPKGTLFSIILAVMGVVCDDSCMRYILKKTAKYYRTILKTYDILCFDALKPQHIVFRKLIYDNLK